MNWMRPPGFAHRANETPGPARTTPQRTATPRAPSSSPRARRTRTPGTDVTDRIQQTYDRDTLLVTNTGPRSEGYTYCTRCGLIEPTARPTGAVVWHATRSRIPTSVSRTAQAIGSTRGLVLGTDFISDVLLVRLGSTSRSRCVRNFLSTQVALRTIAEALTIAATQRLEIEASELQAEYRPALTPAGHHGLEAEIYLYDTLAGGAGFTRRVSGFGLAIFEEALERLEDCPADCDESCYRCLRSFRNRFEHGLLDRQVGASLLRYLLDGTRADARRTSASTSRSTNCLHDLREPDIDGVEFLSERARRRRRTSER